MLRNFYFIQNTRWTSQIFSPTTIGLSVTIPNVEVSSVGFPVWLSDLPVVFHGLKFNQKRQKVSHPFKIDALLQNDLMFENSNEN
jgi:hypothetical protein